MNICIYNLSGKLVIIIKLVNFLLISRKPGNQGRTTKIGQGGKKYTVLRARKISPPPERFPPPWA